MHKNDNNTYTIRAPRNTFFPKYTTFKIRNEIKICFKKYYNSEVNLWVNITLKLTCGSTKIKQCHIR